MYILKELEDDRTLDDYNIHSESTLYLTVRCESGLQVVVLMPTEQTFPLAVKTNDFIKNIKRKFYEMEGIPSDQQRFFFAGKELKDRHMLSHYNIQERSISHLAQTRPPGMQISIDVENKITLEFDQSDFGRFPFTKRFRKFRLRCNWNILFWFVPLENFPEKVELLKR